MSNLALVINNISDGTGAVFTKQRAFRDDEALKQDLANKFQHTYNTNGPDPGNIRFNTIDQLPAGYSGWKVPRLNNSSVHDDVYVVGHPKGIFRSYKASYDHFAHLEWYGLAPGCRCCLCSGNGRGRYEGLRTPVPASIPALQFINVAQGTTAPWPAPAMPMMMAPPAVPFAYTTAPAMPMVTAPMAGPFDINTPFAMPAVTDPTAPPFDFDMAEPVDFAMAAADDFDTPSAIPTFTRPMAPAFDFGNPPAIPKTTAPMAQNFALSPDGPSEESAQFYGPGTSQGQEPAQQKVLISPEADIEIIQRHAKIVLDQIYNGKGVKLLRAMDMIDVDWDQFIDFDAEIHEAQGRNLMEEIAQILHRRLREHEQGN